jgi:signal transduction histidine kinase
MIYRWLAWFRKYIEGLWRALSHWLELNACAPKWLPPRWRQPLVGYLLAVALIMLVTVLEVVAVQLFPNADAVAGILIFLLILFVSLNWGAGPSLLATVLGTLLLIYLIYPPPFTITQKELVDVLQGGLVLLGGLFVTHMGREREHQRREAELAQAEALAHREARQQMEVFLGIAGHELKTPLTSIVLALHVLRRRLDRLIHQEATDQERTALEHMQGYLGRLSQSVGRLERLVDELLDSTRIEAGQLVLHRERTDLRAIVADAVEEQRSLTPDRTIRLQVPPEQPILVCADAQRIGQVVSNYLSNALKYSPEVSPVEVGVAVEGQQGRVWVQDAGSGVPAERQESLWERFYRAPETPVQSGSGVGLGLGLYISRTLIEQHQGQVGLQSTPGHGARFWFTLPLEQRGAG